MNKVILMGRLTRDPEIRYSQNDQSMAIARYTLAVDREDGETEMTVSRQPILSAVPHSGSRPILPSAICARE